MRSMSSLRPLPRSILATTVGILAIAGCQATAGPTSAPATPPPVQATSTLAPAAPSVRATPAALGTITLTDTGCAWDGNPGSIRGGRVAIQVLNETDDYGLFIVHRLHAGKNWQDGEAAIAEIQAALRTGAEWPAEVSDAITEADADAGLGDRIEFVAPAGTYGVVCSANTSPTGDILTVFLAGPLVVE